MGQLKRKLGKASKLILSTSLNIFHKH